MKVGRPLRKLTDKSDKTPVTILGTNSVAGEVRWTLRNTNECVQDMSLFKHTYP